MADYFVHTHMILHLSSHGLSPLKFSFFLNSGTLSLPSPGNATCINVHTYYWKSNWKFLYSWSFAYQVEVWWLECASSVSILYLFICWLGKQWHKERSTVYQTTVLQIQGSYVSDFPAVWTAGVQQLHEKSASLHQHWAVSDFKGRGKVRYFVPTSFLLPLPAHTSSNNTGAQVVRKALGRTVVLILLITVNFRRTPPAQHYHLSLFLLTHS